MLDDPSAYRSGGAGESIAFAVRDTALGPLMMAATRRGVCFVQFGESAPDIHGRQLQKEFPKAELTAANPDSNSAPMPGWSHSKITCPDRSQIPICRSIFAVQPSRFGSGASC